jgi:hypothetical protein
MILIISYAFIIAGFVLSFSVRKLKKQSMNLKIGKVTKVDEGEGCYELLVSYSIDGGENFYEESLTSKKKRYVGEDLTLKIEDDGTISLYKGNRNILLLSFLCWLIGLILCVFA